MHRPLNDQTYDRDKKQKRESKSPTWWELYLKFQIKVYSGNANMCSMRYLARYVTFYSWYYSIDGSICVLCVWNTIYSCLPWNYSLHNGSERCLAHIQRTISSQSFPQIPRTRQKKLIALIHKLMRNEAIQQQKIFQNKQKLDNFAEIAIFI